MSQQKKQKKSEKKLKPAAESQEPKQDAPKTVFKPISEAQALAIDTRADETLFFGNRGAGKTAAQLICFRKMIEDYKDIPIVGLILDTEYKALQDIVRQSRQFFQDLGDGATMTKTMEGYKWRWPNGTELRFDHMKRIDDYYKIHGHSIQFLGFNELTKWPTSDLYDMSMSTLRSGAEVRCRVFSTTNPYGKGHGWVKERFIDPAPTGTLYTKTTQLPNGSVIERTQIAIMGDHEDNPYMTDRDKAALIDSVKHDKKRYKAWVESSWEIALGGAFSDIWDKDIHCLPMFNIPKNWRVDRAFDWGSTSPFAVVWVAESNGEEVQIGSEMKCIPNGSLIVFAEWYGGDQKGQGIRLSPSEIARGIIARERAMLDSGLIKITPKGGAADNEIYGKRRTDIDTIADEMQRHGVKWTAFNKGHGTRELGKQLIRERLNASAWNDGRGLYFTYNCPNAINQIPRLEDDGEDIAKDQNDHLYDAIRYKVLQRHNMAARLKAAFKF